MTTPAIKGLTNIRHYDFDGTLVVPLYCLMFMDTNDVKPAASQADQATEAANQVLFSTNFVGLAAESRKATDTATETSFPIITDEIVEMDCDSATFEIGDRIAAQEQAGGTALENLKVIETADNDKTIGVVTKRYASATTRVRFRVTGRHDNIAALDN